MKNKSTAFEIAYGAVQIWEAWLSAFPSEAINNIFEVISCSKKTKSYGGAL